jgi:adenine/guanine/hypoxanthine permease
VGLLGTSTVTAYIESAAGVSQGARTWRSNVVVAALFLLALAFTPLFATIGGGVFDPSAEGRVFYPLTAPALLVVGSLMAVAMRRIALRFLWL